MIYSYFDTVNGGILHLHAGERLASTRYSDEKPGVMFYSIAFNTGESTTIEMDGIVYPFPAFAIIPIMFNQQYRFGASKGIVCWQFNREFYCIVNHDREVGCAGFLFYGSWGQWVLDTDPNERRKLLLLLEVFKEEFSDRDDVQGNMLRMLLVRLIITVTRLARQLLPASAQQATDDKFDLMRNYNLLVEKHFRQEHEVKFYAAALFKSPKTLTNTFARFNSPSPLQIIHGRLLLEAKRLLYFTAKPIGDVSAELGFEDAAHFTKFFRKNVNSSPSDFRKTSTTP